MGWGIVNYPCMPCAEKLRQSGDEDMARLPEECALITGIAACNRNDSANMEAVYGGCCGLWPGRMGLACAPALSAANGSLLHQGTALQPQTSSRHKRLANMRVQRSLARSGAAIVGCRAALARSYGTGCQSYMDLQSHMARLLDQARQGRMAHRIYLARQRGAICPTGSNCPSGARPTVPLACAGSQAPAAERSGLRLLAREVYT